MLDKLFEISQYFNWISPLLACIQDVINGPAYTFLIPEDCGWSGLQIERMLRENGVRIWGQMIFRRTIMFTVREAQVKWAQHLLQREGIPIQNPRERFPASKRRAVHRRVQQPSLLHSLEASLEGLDRALKRIL